MEPLCMTRWAIELRLVIAPRLDGAFCVLGISAATCALEMGFFGLALWKKLANERQDEDSNNDCADDEFR